MIDFQFIEHQFLMFTLGFDKNVDQLLTNRNTVVNFS